MRSRRSPSVPRYLRDRDWAGLSNHGSPGPVAAATLSIIISVIQPRIILSNPAQSASSLVDPSWRVVVSQDGLLRDSRPVCTLPAAAPPVRVRPSATLSARVGSHVRSRNYVCRWACNLAHSNDTTLALVNAMVRVLFCSGE